MRLSLVLGALSSLAMIPAAHAATIPLMDVKTVQGCDIHEIQTTNLARHYPCTNGDYLALVKDGPNLRMVRYPTAKVPQPDLYGGPVAPQQVMLTKPVIPPAPAGIRASHWKCLQPLAERSLPLEQQYLKCASMHEVNQSWTLDNPAEPYYFYTATTTEFLGRVEPTLTQHYAQAPTEPVRPSLDDQMAVARFNASHRGGLAHEPTSEAIVQRTADGGVYTASYQKPPSAGMVICAFVCGPLAEGVAARIAGNSGYRYYYPGRSISPNGSYFYLGHTGDPISQGGAPRQ